MVDLVPEFHDAGKLVDLNWLKVFLAQSTGYSVDKISLGHDFILRLGDNELSYAFGKILGTDEPDNLTWMCIKSHHKDIWDFDVGLLRVADRMASSLSRLLTEEEKKRLQMETTKEGTHKLWNPEFSKGDLALLSTVEEVRALIQLVNNQEIEEFLRVYKTLLSKRPEDFFPPNNIVSLYTHLILVGKFYRVLKGGARVEADGLLSFENAKANSVKEAENNWQIKLVRCKVGFSQSPIKVKDLNIFSILKEKMSDLRKDNHAFPFSSDEFLALLPSKMDMQSLLKPFIDNGFFVEIISVQTSIERLEPDPKSMIEEEKAQLKNRIDSIKRRIEIPEQRRGQLIIREQEESCKRYQETRLYRNLSPEIKPLICEVCQMEMADTSWSDEESGVVEHLCQRCADIRNSRDGLTKLAAWTYEENIQVCWINIRLLFDELLKALGNLYLDYLKSMGIDVTQTDIRFAVLEEFHRDFEAFLGDFSKGLLNIFVADNVEQPLDDLFIVKIEKLSSMMKVLELFNNCLNQYFPAFKHLKSSPVKLSISSSNVKFPFSEHWRLLNSSEEDISITVMGRGKLMLNVSGIDEVLTKVKLPNKTLLHRLVNIANVSETLAEIELFENEKVLNFPVSLNFESIITLAKILEE